MRGESDFDPMTIPHKIQLVVGVMVILLLGAFVLINHQSTEVNFIFGSLIMSRALLILITFFAGVLVGWLAHSIVGIRRRAAKERQSE